MITVNALSNIQQTSMILFKPYSSIKGFLKRFTILKVGNLHVRLHQILDIDRSTVLHNHPFNYVSIVLWGGYSDYTKIKGKNCDMTVSKTKHKWLSVIKRKHTAWHRITDVKPNTITLFIAYGKYKWKALSVKASTDDGIHQRKINGNLVWCKKNAGVWYIGNKDMGIAIAETRHSIHQVIEKI